jgi:hypothetical protein
MRKVYGLTQNVLWVFLGFCILTPTAYAYLDAGSGSMMVQILLAGVAGIGVALKVYWRRLRAFFGKSQSKNGEKDKSSP